MKIVVTCLNENAFMEVRCALFIKGRINVLFNNTCFIVHGWAASLVMYLPAFALIGHTYHLDPSQVSLSVSVYMISFAIGQLVLGGLSDRFRPKLILYTSFVIFVFGVLLTFVPHSSFCFYLARVFQGIACGGLTATSRAMINRSYTGQKLVSMLTMATIAASLTGAISPVIGGYLAHYGNWHGIFVLLGVYSVLLLVLTSFLSCPTDDNAKPQFVSNTMSWTRSKVYLLSNQTFLFPALAASIGFTILVGYYTIAPYMFENLLHVSAKDFGFFSIATSGAYIVSALVNTFGIGKEKNRLFYGYASMLVSSLGIFLLISLGYRSVPVLLVLIMFSGVGVGLTFAINMSSAVRKFKNIAGSAGSLMGALQLACAALGSFILSNFVGTHVILCLACFILICTILSTVFSILGRRLLSE